MKQVDQLHSFLLTDMNKAVAHLDQVLKALGCLRQRSGPRREIRFRRRQGTGNGGPQMSMSGNKSRLVGLTREISAQWAETKNYWRDAKSQEFEQRYMTELFANVDRTVTILEKLEEVLKKVRSDCE